MMTEEEIKKLMENLHLFATGENVSLDIENLKRYEEEKANEATDKES